MYYFEYDPQGGAVVTIHQTRPEVIGKGMALAQSDAFEPGQEMEYTITINEIDEGGQVISHSAIRHNPQAGRLLKENQQLKLDLGNVLFESAMDKAKISELENTTGDLLLEVALLKMAGGVV